MAKCKSIIILTLVILLIATVLSSCLEISDQKNNKTSSTTTKANDEIDPWEQGYLTTIYHGIWFKDETDASFEKGHFEYQDSGVFRDNINVFTQLQLSMNNAVYVPSNITPSDTSEFVRIDFTKNYGNKEQLKIWYVYNYKTKEVLCCYDNTWYTVSEYELLVEDIAVFGGEFFYDYLKLIRYPDNSLEGDCTFFYDRFFARKTGVDPSRYSNFVNTQPTEDMNREKAITLSQKELTHYKNAKFSRCMSDPISGYWCVRFIDDENNTYIYVYLDQYGCTVQLTPWPSNIER